MSESVEKMFSEISPTYDKLNHFLSFNFDKGWRRKSIKMIQKSNGDAFSALDLCAGTHDFGLECVKQFPNAKIKAMDFSQNMLNAGWHKIKDLDGQIEPICGDALKMPFENDSFDVIFCGYGARNFDDLKSGLAEIHRVLKPGGQALILEFFKPTSVLNKSFQATYGQYVLPWLGKLISGHQGAYTYLRDSIRGFVTTQEFQVAAEKTGLKHHKTKSFFMNISSCVSLLKKENS